MNKSFVVVILFVIFSVCSCKNEGDQSEIEAIVSGFYQADYAYEETTEIYDSEGSLRMRSVYEGVVFQSPYKEHRKQISYENFHRSRDTENLRIHEIYFRGFHKAVIAYIRTDHGWGKQMITRDYPYGHGESITFSEVLDQMLSTDMEDVFTGEYIVDPPEGFPQQIAATVTQKYYINKKSRTVTRIETDLTDLTRMIMIVNGINTNEDTLEEAEKRVSDDEIKEVNILTITDYGNPDDFQIPNIPD